MLVWFTADVESLDPRCENGGGGMRKEGLTGSKVKAVVLNHHWVKRPFRSSPSQKDTFRYRDSWSCGRLSQFFYKRQTGSSAQLTLPALNTFT